MYAKVFKSLFYGSLTGQSDPQLVFMCLLTHADRKGFVELPAAVISALTGLSLEQVVAAVATLEAPDEKSRSAEMEGRRLEVIGESRWFIVNHPKYSAMRDEDARREQNLAAQQKRRRQPVSANVSRGQPQSAHIDVDVDVDEGNRHSPPSGGFRVDFEQIWKAYPHYGRRSSKARSLARWTALAPRPELPVVLKAISSSKDSDDWMRESGRFVPALEVWIAKQGWDSSDGSPSASVANGSGESAEDRRRRWKREGIL